MNLKKLWLNYKDSVRSKLIVNVILIHAVLMGFIVYDLYDREASFMKKQLSQKGHDLTSILSKSAVVPFLNNDLIALKELITDTDNITNIKEIFILDKRLKVKASTSSDYFNKTLDDKISLDIVLKLEKSSNNYFQMTHSNLIDTIHNIKVNNKVIGYVRTLIDKKALTNQLKIMTSKGLLYVFIAILLGAIFAWLSMQAMTKKLQIASMVAEEISNKNFSIELELPTNNDEVSKVLRAFIIMKKSIQDYIGELKRSNKIIYKEKTLAEVTLSSIGDSVIVTNKDGNVTFINPPAEKILAYSKYEAYTLKIDELFELYCENTNSKLKSSVYKAMKRKKVIRNKDSIILVNRNLEKFYIEKSASPIVGIDGAIEGAVLVIHDASEERKTQIDMRWNATHDSLTKLSNRIAFDVVLSNLIKRVKRDSSSHVFFFMDLDKFKIINDTVGHIVGDQVLKDIAILLKNNLRENDFIFRFGGDEFGVILFDCDINSATKIAQNFIDKVSEYKIDVNERVFQIGLSIGISKINSEHCDFKDILSSADFACYLAKNSGRNRFHIASAEDLEQLNKEFGLNWISKINSALKNNKFILYIQKIKDLSQDNDHYEILLRMYDEDGNMIFPNTFLPYAEKYSLMYEIDNYVIETFFNWFNLNKDTLNKNLLFSINITGQSISNKNFLKNILNLVNRYNIDPKKIIFEITETTAIANIDQSKRFFSLLSEKGFKFSLDDFGTGLSSFEYLKNMPINYLKIDGTFIKDILTDPIDRGMVEAIYKIGSMMGLKIIAEYAENNDIIAELKKIGIHYAQGYAVERPHPIIDLGDKIE